MTERTLVDRVVSVVENQTTPAQPDTFPASKIVMLLAEYGREDHAEVRDAIEEAIVSGRLETDGEERVWVAEE